MDGYLFPVWSLVRLNGQIVAKRRNTEQCIFVEFAWETRCCLGNSNVTVKPVLEKQRCA